MGDLAGVGAWLPDIGLSGIVALFFISMFTGKLVTSSSMQKAYEALESRAKVAEQREAEANARTEIALRLAEQQGKQLDKVLGEQGATMLSILQALPYAGGGKRDAE